MSLCIYLVTNVRDRDPIFLHYWSHWIGNLEWNKNPFLPVLTIYHQDNKGKNNDSPAKQKLLDNVGNMLGIPAHNYCQSVYWDCGCRCGAESVVLASFISTGFQDNQINTMLILATISLESIRVKVKYSISNLLEKIHNQITYNIIRGCSSFVSSALPKGASMASIGVTMIWPITMKIKGHDIKEICKSTGKINNNSINFRQ